MKLGLKWNRKNYKITKSDGSIVIAYSNQKYLIKQILLFFKLHVYELQFTYKIEKITDLEKSHFVRVDDFEIIITEYTSYKELRYFVKELLKEVFKINITVDEIEFNSLETQEIFIPSDDKPVKIENV